MLYLWQNKTSHSHYMIVVTLEVILMIVAIVFSSLLIYFYLEFLVGNSFSQHRNIIHALILYVLMMYYYQMCIFDNRCHILDVHFMLSHVITIFTSWINIVANDSARASCWNLFLQTRDALENVSFILSTQTS